jgi:hypothetical protein
METKQWLYEGLDDFPVLRRKLQNFCVDHSLEERPALVWQCIPLDSCEVLLSSKDLSAALEEGAGDKKDQSGWWYGFRAGQRPVPVFDGLAAHNGNSDLGWTTEIHSDGGVIAGLWTFPSVPSQEGTSHLVVSDFHESAFADFASLATRLFATAPIAYPALVTCTMLNAPMVRFHRNRFRHPVVGPRRNTLQWRVRKADSGEHVDAVLKLMSAELVRAYGLLPLSA